jgi:hypothetical protein
VLGEAVQTYSIAISCFPTLARFDLVVASRIASYLSNASFAHWFPQFIDLYNFHGFQWIIEAIVHSSLLPETDLGLSPTLGRGE